MHTQIVLVEFRNTAPFVERLTSSEPIDIERAAAYYIEREGFDENEDALTFISEPDEMNIDETKEPKDR